MNEELKAKLEELEKSGFHDAFTSPDKNTISWGDKLGLDEKDRLLDAIDGKLDVTVFELPVDQLPPRDEAYKIDELLNMGIDISKIKEVSYNESELFKYIKTQSPIQIAPPTQKPPTAEINESASASASAEMTPVSPNGIVTDQKDSPLADTENKFSVIETDTGSVYLVVHEKDMDYIADLTNNPDKLMESITALRGGFDIIDRDKIIEKGNIEPFEFDGQPTTVATNEGIDMYAMASAKATQQALNLDYSEEQWKDIAENLQDKDASARLYSWSDYDKDRNNEATREASPQGNEQDKDAEIFAGAIDEEITGAEEPDEPEPSVNELNPEPSANEIEPESIQIETITIDTDFTNEDSVSEVSPLVPLHDHPDYKDLVATLEANGRDTTFVKELVAHVEALESKCEKQSELLGELSTKIDKLGDSPFKKPVEEFINGAKNCVEATKELCENFKQAIIGGCKSALDAFNNNTIKGTDHVAKFFNIEGLYKSVYQSNQKQIEMCDKALDKIDSITKEYHNAGASLKNTGISLGNIFRSIIGKEPKEIVEAKAAGKLSKSLTAIVKSSKSICESACKECADKGRALRDLSARADNIREKQADPKKEVSKGKTLDTLKEKVKERETPKQGKKDSPDKGRTDKPTEER